MKEIDDLEIPDLIENEFDLEDPELRKLHESIVKTGLGDIILDDIRRGNNVKLPLIKERATIENLKFDIKFTQNETLPSVKNVSLIVFYPGIMETGQGRLGQKPFQLGTIESGTFVFNEYFGKPYDPPLNEIQKTYLKEYVDNSHHKEILESVHKYKNKFNNILAGI